MSVDVLRAASRRIAASVLLLWAADRAQAGPLNPLDFASLGTLNTAPGTYNITTSGTPTLTSPDGTTFTGVVSNGIAVFDFNSTNVVAGSTIDVNASFNPGQPTPTLPVALLSQTNATIAGNIDVFPTSESGPGAGGNGQVFSSSIGTERFFTVSGSGGGGFGTPGGAGQGILAGTPQGPVPLLGGPGGGTYGDLSQQLQMGSPGGVSYGPLGTAGPAAPGGGAIELGALDAIAISGAISARGANNPLISPTLFSGGGGSGGSIYIHAPSVDLTGQLMVFGGLGGPGGSDPDDSYAPGGNGGSGLVLIQTPEPPSLLLSGLSVVAGLGLAWRRRRRTAA